MTGGMREQNTKGLFAADFTKVHWASWCPVTAGGSVDFTGQTPFCVRLHVSESAWVPKTSVSQVEIVEVKLVLCLLCYIKIVTPPSPQNSLDGLCGPVAIAGCSMTERLPAQIPLHSSFS